ncbi:hypothetical protein BDB00DRAFT_788603 [Zychaea mexicana]|uniref:uncharacterized protein n=1 Tax=Zychaea mexicana TaxID=64656 RepID=UPI0022FE3DF0|nr:uncharacterized protein BDB00DRAFT_788603 [Zychaea mexicana]KAI9492617.1 hypothetical protein BDB00DRAFT_788603 [Zychaea mexicana]
MPNGTMKHNFRCHRNQRVYLVLGDFDPKQRLYPNPQSDKLDPDAIEGSSPYLHWMYSSYVPPAPPAGSGIHRYIFAVYEQPQLWKTTGSYTVKSRWFGLLGNRVRKYCALSFLGSIRRQDTVVNKDTGKTKTGAAGAHSADWSFEPDEGAFLGTMNGVVDVNGRSVCLNITAAEQYRFA